MTKSPVKLPPALNEVKGPAADELKRRIVYDDPKHHIRLYQGDCLELLALLPADSIDLIFVDLALPTQGLDQYKSISSESWGARELYCPRCSSNSLDVLPGNTPVLDYRCPVCSSGFQLKSAASAFRAKLTDGAYSQMRAAILGGHTPNLFLLQYQVSPLSVTSLFFIPDFAFTLSALECRLPLAPTARRAGWIGCNILLNRVPIDACVRLVHEKRAVPAGDVRRAFRKLKPLASLSAEKRGWVLDVLTSFALFTRNPSRCPRSTHSTST